MFGYGSAFMKHRISMFHGCLKFLFKHNSVIENSGDSDAVHPGPGKATIGG